MPLRGVSLSFSASPRFASATSYSNTWPSRDRPANDGSCDENVAVMILEAFDIPIVGAHPPRGNLCGLDINNMAASAALKLSLAENIADGIIYEVYVNEYGQAYFQEVYPNAPVVNLDIRLCIPSSNINNKVDGVIVRGYDKPPVRSFKDFYTVIGRGTGPLNPSSVGYKQSYHSLEALLGTSQCIGKIFAKEARVSYKDPVLETSYMDGVDNLYELNAFESLVGYVIDFDGSSDQNVKYAFSDTSLFDIEIDLSGFSFGSATMCTEAGLTTMTYGEMTSHIGPFNSYDKYGDIWPLLNSVSQLTCVGYKIKYIYDYTSFPSSETQVVCDVSSNKEVFSLAAGTNWYWELSSNSSADVHIYYPVGEQSSTTYISADLLSSTYAGTRAYVREGFYYNANNPATGSLIYGTPIPNVAGGLGVVLTKLIATVEIDRPSVTVQHQGGEALSYAQDLEVKYQPIIVTDEPAPVAYTFGSGAQLVDHTLDLFDADPATIEVSPSLRTGSMAWLQSQVKGNMIDVSLPFLDEDSCLSFADTLYNVYNETETTYNLVCGPTSKPQLGARVAGYSGRINSITYSYQDSSSYNINVNIGPVMTNVGSWSNTMWQKRTEDVSREGIIVWTAGNGVDYLVRVRGLGVYPAVNATLAAYAPGEKVQVTIHNNPVES